MNDEKPNPLRDYIRNNPCQGFKSCVHYSATGDFVEHHIVDELAYAEQLSPYLTILRSMKTKEIVGVKVFGVLQPVLEAMQRKADRSKEKAVTLEGLVERLESDDLVQ